MPPGSRVSGAWCPGGSGLVGYAAGPWLRSAAAVEPECPGLNRPDPQQPRHRPRVRTEARLDLALVGRLDDVQRPVALAERAADDDEPIVHQAVHEGCVLIPAILGPDLARRIPARTVDQCHREVGHGRRVLPVTDRTVAARPA